MSPLFPAMPSFLRQTALFLFDLPCRVYVSCIENSYVCVPQKVGGGGGAGTLTAKWTVLE